MTLNIFSIIIVSAFIWISSIPVIQAETESPSTSSVDPDSKPPTAIKAEPANLEKKTRSTTSAAALDQKGKVEKIDVTASSFVVAGKTFVLAQHSRVEIDGSLMSLKNLKEGDLVAVVYFAKADGMNTATRVIKGNAPRKSTAKKPAASTSTSQ